MSDCGPMRESCCTSLLVSGGKFNRTYNTAGATSGPPDGGWPDEANPATVSDFRLDKYPVTYGRFKQFFAAVGGGWTPPAGSGKHTHLNGGLGLNTFPVLSAALDYERGWDPSWSGTLSSLAPPAAGSGCVGSAAGEEPLPVNCVDWYTAYGFCIWDGGFLPSDAEWQYAAAGGSEERVFPWGSADPGTMNEYAVYDCYYGDGGNRNDAGCNVVTGAIPVTVLAPVGAAPRGAGRWGQLDLAGELIQWTLDDQGLYANPCTDCSYLNISTTLRAGRGGAFNAPLSWMVQAQLPTYDFQHSPDLALELGIRCARTP